MSSDLSPAATGQFSDATSSVSPNPPHLSTIGFDPPSVISQLSSHSAAISSEEDAPESILTVALTDAGVGRTIQQILQQTSPSNMDVLQIRRSFPSSALPDTRQLNRVLYSLAEAGAVEKLDPLGRSLKPRWATPQSTRDHRH
mmetsp:Transcript_11007/g.30428  ORF Transcript_11007/g.30428 Transcript_11007/m.30428 type:complete len:143 (+) Transcript_11007:5203-5631(+)